MQVLWAAAVLIDIIFWLLFDWCRLSHLYFTCFLTDFLLCKYCKNGTSSTVFFKCYCHFLVFQCICSKRTVVLNRHSDSVVMKTEFALNLFAAWSRFYLCIGIPFYKWFYCVIVYSRRCRTKYKAMKPEVIDALNKMKVILLLGSTL